MARRRLGRAPGPIVGQKKKGKGQSDAGKSHRIAKAEEASRGNWDSEGEPEDSDAGQVNSEDDEDIDSDEAFDESDEERFSTFKFLGSSSTTVIPCNICELRVEEAKERRSRTKRG